MFVKNKNSRKLERKKENFIKILKVPSSMIGTEWDMNIIGVYQTIQVEFVTATSLADQPSTLLFIQDETRNMGTKKFTCKKCIKTRQHQVAIVIYKSVIYIGLVNLCSKCIPPLLNLDSPLESLAMSRFSSVLLKLPSLPTHCQACLNRFANITHYVPS